MCSLFGLLDYGRNLSKKQRIKIMQVLSKEAEVRGTDATGFAYVENENLKIYKRPLPAHRIRLRFPADVHYIMGHARMTTQGTERYNYNNHPFLGNVENTAFALAHNGVLHNDKILRRTNHLSDTKIETDSYIAVQLIEQSNTLHLQSLKDMAEQVEGSFSFTVLDQCNQLFFIKGDSPLSIRKYMQNGFYLYASTNEILQRATSRLRISNLPYKNVTVQCGDILKINSDGNIQRANFTYRTLYEWNSPINHRLPVFPAFEEYQNEGEPLQELIEFSGNLGVKEQDIYLLYSNGYTVNDIENMLYFPSLLHHCLDEIREKHSVYSW